MAIDEGAWYDRLLRPVEKTFMAPARRWVTARARGQVLEIGAGTGANFPYYRDDVALTANDINPRMLDRARRRAADLGRGVRFHVGSGAELPYDDATFDTVLATFVLCGFHDERKGLVEMLRVLKPGGTLLLADHIPSTNRVLHAVQWLLERITGPLFDEHWLRRPSVVLRELDVDVVAPERHRAGAVEYVRATKRA